MPSVGDLRNRAKGPDEKHRRGLVTQSRSAKLVAELALKAAKKHHGSQLRKDGTLAVDHLRRTAAVAEEIAAVLGLSDSHRSECLCTALLHDFIEDTRADFEDVVQIFEHDEIGDSAFGVRIANLVACLSDDKRKPESERHEEYVLSIGQAPLVAKVVKLADTLDNLRHVDVLADATRSRIKRKLRRLLEIIGRNEQLRATAFFIEAKERGREEG